MSDVPVIRTATVAKFREIITAYDASRLRVEGLHREIAQEEQLQEQLGAQAQQCHSTAMLFDFDLIAGLAAADDLAGDGQSGTSAAMITPLAPPWANTRPVSVREFILGRAEAAYPSPVRAKALKVEYEKAFGTEIHEKTVGMTLYRIAQRDRSMRREGWDWFYVPTELRGIDNETQELPYEGS